MRRREFLGSAAAPLAKGAAAARRPNVVLILADDLGWRDTGFNGSEIPTPNIDRIARRGVRFTHLYAFPFCSPTRAALMTGRNPTRYGLVYSVIRPWSHYGVPLDEHMMPETFRALGYQTWITGKWHLGHAHRRMLPHHRGFDHFYGHVNAEIDFFEHTHPSGGLDWQRNGKGVREQGYTTDLLCAEALSLIRQRERSRPFFLYVPFNAVHFPLQAPQPLIDKHSHIANKSRRVYAAMLDSMDTAVGRILDTLDQQGLTRDTLVLFLSDNGGAPSSGGRNEPLRAAKGTVYEGGIRVPACLSWPGHIKEGGEVRQVMTVMDLLPTLAAAVNGTHGARKPLDGHNRWPQILGAAPAAPENLFFAVKRNETPDYFYGLRDREWKLVREEIGGAVKSQALYNIDRDQYEKADLAAQHPEIVERLSGLLDGWRNLHPKCEIQSSMTPHPGWIPPADYAAAAAGYEPGELPSGSNR